MNLGSIKAANQSLAATRTVTVSKVARPRVSKTTIVQKGCEFCELQGRAKADIEHTPSTYAIVLPSITSYTQVKREYSKLAGNGGALLKTTLQQAGFNYSKAYTTFAIKCYAPPDTNTLACATSCSDILVEELKTMGVKVVLAFGPESMKGLFGSSAVGNVQGLLCWHEDLQAYVIPCYSPDEVLAKPELFRDFSEAILQFCGAPLEHVEEDKDPDMEIVYDRMRFKEITQSLKHATHIALDIETTGLNPLYDRILSIGFCGDGKQAYIIPTEYLDSDPKFIQALKVWLEASTITGGHNACQFDAKMIYKKYGIDWMPTWDTLYGHYCVDERQYGHGLKRLASKYLNAPHYSSEMEEIDYKNGQTMADVDPMKVYTYQSWDCIYTWRLKVIVDKQMEEEETKSVHDTILVPGGNAFRDIELYGTLTDKEYLEKIQVKYAAEIAEELKEVQQMAAEKGMPDFNPNSPPQVKELLFNRVGVPKNQWGKTGKDELEGLAPKYPIVDKILKLRTKMRIKRGYIDSLLEKIDPNTGRVYPRFLLFGTQTGRLSCQDPNLQNQPMMVGPLIRYAFKAQEGFTLIEGDFNQLELKVVAWFSKDPDLIDVFKHGGDIHSVVGEAIFKKPRSEISKQERYKAKLINFGLVYGRSARSLAAQPEFNSTVEEAQNYIDTFFKHYTGLAKWIDSMHKLVQGEGYIPTAFKRKRRFPLLTSANKFEVLRQAQNSPIQGTASDLCLTALTRVHMRLKRHTQWNKDNPKGPHKVDLEDAHILFTVHDAILLEVRKGFEQEVAELLWDEMVEKCPIHADFKFTIDVAKGDRWGTLEHFWPPKEGK